MRSLPRAGLLVLALLATLLAAELRGPLRVEAGAPLPVPAPAGGSGAQPEPPAAFALPEQERYAVVNERPLFMPTRRPPQPPAPAPVTGPAPAPAAPVATPRFEVTAIVREGERWIAVVEHPGRREAIQAEVGATVDGWTVSAIGPEAVDLTLGERTLSLRLRPEGPGERR